MDNNIPHNNIPPIDKPSIWETNPKLKTLLQILIGVFLASGIGLAIWSQVQSNYRQGLYEKTEAELPKHQVKPIDDTRGWKTYRNEKYGFEFMYPNSFNQNAEVGENFFQNEDGHFWLNIMDNPNKKDAEGLKSDYDKQPSEGGGEDSFVDIAGIKTFKAHSPYNGIYDDYFIPYKEIVIYFNFEFNFDPDNQIIRSEKDDLINNILLTLKFTQPADVLSWKIYKNDKYGFEIKYPSSWYLSVLSPMNSDEEHNVTFSVEKNYTDGVYVNVAPFNKAVFDSTGMIGFSKEDMSPIVIGNYTGTWFKSTVDKGTYIEASNFVRVENNNYGYEISLAIPQVDYRNGNNIEIEKEFKQILSTFKFTK